jgi:hypothetical protein
LVVVLVVNQAELATLVMVVMVVLEVALVVELDFPLNQQVVQVIYHKELAEEMLHQALQVLVEVAVRVLAEVAVQAQVEVLVVMEQQVLLQVFL